MQTKPNMKKDCKSGKVDMRRNTSDFRARQIDAILFQTEACYSNMEFDPISLDVWHKALAEYEIDEISKAFNEHVLESPFLPKICDIISRIKNKKEPQISIEARAQQQWRAVLTAVTKYGRARQPKFSDSITDYLVRNQFRWSYLCNLKEENENWEEKRWCDAYRLAAETHQDLKQIEAPQKVKELVNNITSPVTDPASNPEVTVETIKAFRERLKNRVQRQQDREARIKMLKEKAEKIMNREPAIEGITDETC